MHKYIKPFLDKTKIVLAAPPTAPCPLLALTPTQPHHYLPVNLTLFTVPVCLLSSVGCSTMYFEKSPDLPTVLIISLKKLYSCEHKEKKTLIGGMVFSSVRKGVRWSLWPWGPLGGLNLTLHTSDGLYINTSCKHLLSDYY